MKKRIPQFFIEQKALGELDSRHEKYFQEDPGLLDEAKHLQADNEEILQKYPADKMAALIKARSEKVKMSRTESSQEESDESSSKIIGFFRSPAPLLAAAALAVLIGIVPVYRSIQNNNQSSFIEGNRLKGLKPTLTVYRETQSGIEELTEGDFVQEHDLLQIEYNAGNFPYGVLLSVDGRGIVTLHYPANEHSSQELERGAGSMIPYAYELDDAPGFERFFFLFSENELNISEIMNRADNLAASDKIKTADELVNNPDIYETSVLLLKE